MGTQIAVLAVAGLLLRLPLPLQAKTLEQASRDAASILSSSNDDSACSRVNKALTILNSPETNTGSPGFLKASTPENMPAPIEYTPQYWGVAGDDGRAWSGYRLKEAAYPASAVRVSRQQIKATLESLCHTGRPTGRMLAGVLKELLPSMVHEKAMQQNDAPLGIVSTDNGAVWPLYHYSKEKMDKLFQQAIGVLEGR